MPALSILGDLRKEYHSKLQNTIWGISDKGVASNADSHHNTSTAIGRGMLEETKEPTKRAVAQTSGQKFTFSLIGKLLNSLEKDDSNSKDLRAMFASGYLITPDIVIARKPISDEIINENEDLLNHNTDLATYTPLREAKNNTLMLHASVSCKWTIRSDRSQNSRTEALNLIRNRKGNTPHIVVVTGEPLPSRIASIALGTGDIDCVYHMALYEMEAAINNYREKDESAAEMFETLVLGRRLRDISDLPFDLAI